MKEKRFNKIIATLGPSIAKKGILNKIDKFVDAYKVSLSYTNVMQMREIIKIIRNINDKKVIILDIKGPQTITENEDIEVKEGEVLNVGNGNFDIKFNFNEITKISEDTHINFGNGDVQGFVKEKKGRNIIIKITQGGIIKKGKKVNFIGYEPNLEFITENTKKNIKFMIEEEICIVCLGNIKTHNDINTVKNYIEENYGEQEIKIIARIETQSAVNDIENIIKNSDGIILARGNLGLNSEIIDLPRIQQKITQIANNAGKPIILSKQTMPSMVDQNAPTRAEIDEIVYSIQSGIDIIMLSEETATGNYPIEAASILNDIIIKYQKENGRKYEREDISKYTKDSNQITDYILYNSKKIAYKLGAKLMVVFTVTGHGPGRIASLKPNMTVLAFTSSDAVFKYCNLMFGIEGHKISKQDINYNQLKKIVGETIQTKYKGKIKGEDRIVILHSSVKENAPQMINTIEVIKFKDL